MGTDGSSGVDLECREELISTSLLDLPSNKRSKPVRTSPTKILCASVLSPSLKLFRKYLLAEFHPSWSKPYLVRTPVRVKSVLRAPVPLYWTEIMSA